MSDLKPCPKRNDQRYCIGKYSFACNIEIAKTMAKPPKNIRIGCTKHEYWLPESFSTITEAVEAWNRRIKENKNDNSNLDNRNL